MHFVFTAAPSRLVPPADALPSLGDVVLDVVAMMQSTAQPAQMPATTGREARARVQAERLGAAVGGSKWKPKSYAVDRHDDVLAALRKLGGHSTTQALAREMGRSVKESGTKTSGGSWLNRVLKDMAAKGLVTLGEKRSHAYDRERTVTLVQR